MKTSEYAWKTLPYRLLPRVGRRAKKVARGETSGVTGHFNSRTEGARRVWARFHRANRYYICSRRSTSGYLRDAAPAAETRCLRTSHVVPGVRCNGLHQDAKDTLKTAGLRRNTPS